MFVELERLERRAGGSHLVQAPNPVTPTGTMTTIQNRLSVVCFGHSAVI